MIQNSLKLVNYSDIDHELLNKIIYDVGKVTKSPFHRSSQGCSKIKLYVEGYHSVLTGCVIIFEMTVTPSLFVKSSIYTCRIDMYPMIKNRFALSLLLPTR